MNSRKKNVDDDLPFRTASSPAPMIITIGPQNVGKTTWLKNLQELETKHQNLPPNEIIDVCLDEQPNVYIPIPAQIFCMPSESLKLGTNISQSHQRILNQTIFQKTILDRVLATEQEELRLVVQRIAGMISRNEFEKSMKASFDARRNQTEGRRTNNVANLNIDATKQASEEDEEIVAVLVESVENLMDHPTTVALPDTIDLFVVDALFRNGIADNVSSPQTEDLTGIERAIQSLRSSPQNFTVAWGNTNSKPSDYRAALEVAQQHQRPVYFCIFNALNDSSIQESSNLFDIPYVGFIDLVTRNLNRFLQTGRYIPSKAMWDTSKRVQQLVGDVVRQVQEQNQTRAGVPGQDNYTSVLTKFEVHRQFARLLKFEMRRDRTVELRRSEYNQQERPGRGRWDNRQRGWQPDIFNDSRGRGPRHGKSHHPYDSLGGRGSPREPHFRSDRSSGRTNNTVPSNASIPAQGRGRWRDSQSRSGGDRNRYHSRESRAQFQRASGRGRYSRGRGPRHGKSHHPYDSLGGRGSPREPHFRSDRSSGRTNNTVPSNASIPAQGRGRWRDSQSRSGGDRNRYHSRESRAQFQRASGRGRYSSGRGRWGRYGDDRGDPRHGRAPSQYQQQRSNTSSTNESSQLF